MISAWWLLTIAPATAVGFIYGLSAGVKFLDLITKLNEGVILGRLAEALKYGVESAEKKYGESSESEENDE